MLQRASLVVILFLSLACTGGCSSGPPEDQEEAYEGVTRALALDRAARVSDVVYNLTFRIPPEPGMPLGGSLMARFQLTDPDRPLEFDFQAPADHLQAVTSQARPVPFEFSRGRIVISAEALKEGTNSLEFSFQPTDLALNRRDEYLYSLFVPDRASTAFPCFDQPDIKGRYRLILSMPEDWTSVSNGSDLGSMLVGDRKTTRFAETDPLSTYQFAFAAGRFQVVEGTLGDRPVRIFHRETDAEKIVRNLPSVLKLHAEALAWLEEYTGIPYPYQKFDFVLVPSFQFGGMEHPGAIYYRDTGLLLEPSATQSQFLGRARLIAHETAHMWFGNLVTMGWFNDVWMKEVFANFMAAKIVNPSFPEIDHELGFLLSHHPAAYDVDRSRGTHPIRQELENLKYAASLYGPIIYQKAPVVMRQLEEIIGEESLRTGLRQYLEKFGHGNAEWGDLVAILDEGTELDLAAWSRVWVEEAGRPTVDFDSPGGSGLTLEQLDPAGSARLWPQRVSPAIEIAGMLRPVPVFLDGPAVPVPLPEGAAADGLRLPNVHPAGYALFRLDAGSVDPLLARIGSFEGAAVRAQAWFTLWDAVLEGDLDGGRFLAALVREIPQEKDALLQEYLLGLLRESFWLYSGSGGLKPEAMEAMLWEGLVDGSDPGRKKAFLKALQSLVQQDATVERLVKIWDGTAGIPGLELGEEDRIGLAFELALRMEGEQAASILDRQEAEIGNPERQTEFHFVRRALSPDEGERASHFDSILAGIGRDRETWVLQSLHFLTHPLRGEEGRTAAAAGLEALPQVEQAGSIFYPARWLDALFWGKSSPELAGFVEEYLEGRPELPERLRLKVFQATDKLFRAARGLR